MPLMPRAAALVAAVLASSTLVAVAAPAQASTPPACPAAGISVTSLNPPRFYIDTGKTPALTAGYAGYRVTSTSARSDLWVRVSAFTGGQVRLAATQPAALPLGTLAAGTGKPAFFLLEAPAASTSAQAHTVEVLAGVPGSTGSSVVCSTTGHFDGVEETIGANSNAVTSVTVTPAQPRLGEGFSITVNGETGTVGAGPANDLGAFYMTPSALPSWPAGQLRMVGTTLTISKDGTVPQTTHTDVLRLGGMAGGNRPYTAVYRFAAVGATATAASAYPNQQIASGTQIKHTNLGSVSIPAIPSATNSLTVALAADPLVVGPSGRSTVTQTLSSTSAGTAEIDQLRLRLPAGVSVVPGSTTYGGVTVPDPVVEGTDLVVAGPFATSSSTPGVLRYQVQLPATEGTFDIRGWGLIGATLLDTTTATTDDVRATRTLQVTVPKSQAITFAQPDDVRYDSGAPALEVSASSGLPVALSSLTPGVCSTSGASVSLTGIGTCTLRATQDGDGAWYAATAVERSFTVAKGAQTVTAPAPADVRLDQDAPVLTGTTSSGLPLTWTAGPADVCTVVDGELRLHGTGECTLTASQPGDERWEPAQDVVHRFTVLRAAPKAQVIDFAQPGDARVGGRSVILDASASSQLDVTLRSLTPETCEVDGTTVVPLDAGACTIEATQDGDGTYAAADSVTRTIEVLPAPKAQEITFTVPDSVQLDQNAPTLSGTATSRLPLTWTAGPADVCTVTDGVLELHGPGTCEVTASQEGDDDWHPADDVTRTFTVRPALQAQTIDFAQPGDARIGGPVVALDAKATSGLDVTLRSLTGMTCSLDGTTVVPLTAGDCIVEATQEGDDTWSAADQVTLTLKVLPAYRAQEITFAQPGDARVGGAPVALDATAGSELPVTVRSLTPDVCTVVDGSVQTHEAGECRLEASQAGDSTWSAAEPVTQTLTVLPAYRAQQITFAQPGDARINGAEVTLDAGASSELPVDLRSLTPETCELDGLTVVALAEGGCTIEATQAGDDTYAPAEAVSRTLQVLPATTLLPQEIDFPALEGVRFGEPAPVLVADASSDLDVTYEVAGDGTVCTLDGSELSLVGVGECTVTASQTGDDRWAPAEPVTRTFTVDQGSQSLWFAVLTDTDLRAEAPGLDAGTRSDLPVGLTSTTPEVCTVTDGTLRLLAAGTCTVVAEQPGDERWLAAEPVERSFRVLPSRQDITFDALTDVRFDQAAPRPRVSADSGLPVGLRSLTEAVCTVDGTAVTLRGAGTCSVEAGQPGDATWQAATPVVRSFTVGKGLQVVTFATPTSVRLDQPAPRLTARAGSGLGVAYVVGPREVCRLVQGAVALIGPGTCSVTAGQAGDASWLPAPDVRRTFTVTPEPVTVYRGVTTTTTGTAPRTVTLSVPAGATLTPAAGTGIASTVAKDGKATLTATAGFSGRTTVDVAVRTTVGTGEAARPRLGRTTVTILVSPDAPLRPAATPKSTTRSTVTWAARPNARSYEVRVGSTVVCLVTSTSCTVNRILGPKDVVQVRSLGASATSSPLVRAAYAPQGKGALRDSVYYATSSSVVTAAEKAELDAVAATIVSKGFTRVELVGNTDSQGSYASNLRLSEARAKAVQSYLAGRLGTYKVQFVLSYVSSDNPVADNTTTQGRALNRRTDVWVR